jgi:hypothetical protein
VLEEAEPEELIDMFDAFDLAVTCDKPGRRWSSTSSSAATRERPPTTSTESTAHGAVAPFVHSGGRFRTDMCDQVPLPGAT